MISSQDYFLAWTVYLFGVLGLMACWWRMTRGIPLFQWRVFARLVVAVLLVTPYYAGPVLLGLAPALVITLLEGVFYGPEAMLRAGVPLLVTLLLAVLVSVLAQLIWQRRRERRQQQDRDQALESERQAMLRESAESQPQG